MFGYGFWIRPANPGWGLWCCPLRIVAGVCGVGLGLGFTPPFLAGVLGFVCLCAFSASTPPVLAGVCGVGVCAWVRVSAAPNDFWRGCWGVCVSVRAPPLPGQRLLGFVVRVSAFGFRSFTPPILAAVLGVCVCVRAPLTPPILAGLRGVGMCAWVRVLAAPRHSWLGCWGVWVSVRALPVPRQSWLAFVVHVCGFRRWLSARHSWLGCWGLCACLCAPPAARQSWLRCAVWLCVLGCGGRLRPAIPSSSVGVGVFLCSLHLYPAIPGWCAGVCVCALAPLVSRDSWFGCAVWVHVPGFQFQLRPAIPGCGVRVCVLVCACRLHPAIPGWGSWCVCV